MRYILFSIALFCCGIIGMVQSIKPDKPVIWIIKICEFAEISPDFTTKEKQDCRLARRNQT